MWKNTRYYVLSLCTMKPSNTSNNVINQILTVLKIKPSNHYSVRNQTTNSKINKVESFTIGKGRPRVSYMKDIQPKKQESKDGVTGGELLLLTVPIATFALGTWQVQRRKWKMGIIEDLEKRTSEPPVEFPNDLAELSSLEYRKVKVKGKYDYSQELYLGPRSLIVNGESASQGGMITSGSRRVAGYCVITPFILSDSGKRILVNRGWVPTASIKPETPVGGQTEEEVEMVGVIRLQEAKGSFVPESKPHLNIFYYRDVKRMAKKCKTLPVVLDADENSSMPNGPIGGQTNISIRNEHMSYIVTWYSISAITGLLWCKKFLFR